MSSHILKVTLAHIRPAIWRRLKVPSNFTLAQLHDVLQVAFGWEDRHLHEFRDGARRFGMLDPDDDGRVLDDRLVAVNWAMPRKGARLEYIYDFGDDWVHKISVERIEADDTRLGGRGLRSGDRAAALACLDGKRARPPEDCGGPPGYDELLDALADPDHPEHAELTEWVGGDFDPDALSIPDINRRLAALA